MSQGPRLTRRDLLGGAAAIGVGAAVAPGVALASGSQRGGVFSHDVGDVAGVSAVIVPGRPFVLAGVQWAGPRAARIEMRARSREGR